MRTATKTLATMIIALAMIGIIGTATVGVAMATGGEEGCTVTRDLPSTADVNTTITVNLTVDLESGACFGIEETVPTEWTVISATGDGDYWTTPGLIVWNPCNGIGTVYSYTVQVPADASGTYTFHGIYWSDLDPAAILGNDTVIVPLAAISIGYITPCDYDFRNVTLPVMVSNAYNIGSMQITVSYNQALITVTAVANGQMDATDAYIDNGNGSVTISAYQDDSDGICGTFELANITFEPVGNGACALTMEPVICLDDTNATTEINLVVNNGEYNTTEFLLGDVNSNGATNVGDVMVLAKYIGGFAGFGIIDECAANVDRNCKPLADLADVSYLAKALLGDPEYTLDPVREMHDCPVPQ